VLKALRMNLSTASVMSKSGSSTAPSKSRRVAIRSLAKRLGLEKRATSIPTSQMEWPSKEELQSHVQRLYRASVPKRFKILCDAGFTEDSSEPMIWIERSRRQAFSENVIGDHDVAWLNQRLAETVPEAEFWFYFRDLSADPLKDCKAVLSRMGMTAVLPVVRTGTRREGVLHSN